MEEELDVFTKITETRETGLISKIIVVRHAESVANTEGKFQFNIPPGDYVINAKNDGISKTCSPVSVSIGADEMRSVNLSCDTGIR